MNNIDQLAASLEAAKIAESKATASRIDAENALLQVIDSKIEGTVTARGHSYRVTATFGITRNIDAVALESIRDSIPAALLERAVRYKPDLLLTGMRYLQNNEPETYSVLAQAITAKPAKPSVRVEAAQEERRAA